LISDFVTFAGCFELRVLILELFVKFFAGELEFDFEIFPYTLEMGTDTELILPGFRLFERGCNGVLDEGLEL
jgi:hypothetical protein